MALTYALIIGLVLVYSRVYQRKERAAGLGPLPVIWLARLYAGYCMLWYAADGGRPLADVSGG